MKKETYKLNGYCVEIKQHKIPFSPLRICIWPKSLTCAAFVNNVPDILIKGSLKTELLKQFSDIYCGTEMQQITINNIDYYVHVVSGTCSAADATFVFAMECSQALAALHLKENIQEFYYSLVGMLHSAAKPKMYSLTVKNSLQDTLHQHKYYYGDAGYQLARCHAQYITKRYSAN